MSKLDSFVIDLRHKVTCQTIKPRHDLFIVWYKDRRIPYFPRYLKICSRNQSTTTCRFCIFIFQQKDYILWHSHQNSSIISLVSRNFNSISDLSSRFLKTKTKNQNNRRKQEEPKINITPSKICFSSHL